MRFLALTLALYVVWYFLSRPRTPKRVKPKPASYATGLPRTLDDFRRQRLLTEELPEPEELKRQREHGQQVGDD